MFPTLRCSFSGIDQIPLHGDCRLLVLMDIVPVDNKRYRYAYHRSSWLVAGKADPPSPARLYLHPDAPYTMEQLRKQVISFEKVKLTNNEMDKSGHVSRLRTLYTFHIEYQNIVSSKNINTLIGNADRHWDCWVTCHILWDHSLVFSSTTKL